MDSSALATSLDGVERTVAGPTEGLVHLATVLAKLEMFMDIATEVSRVSGPVAFDRTGCRQFTGSSLHICGVESSKHSI